MIPFPMLGKGVKGHLTCQGTLALIADACKSCVCTLNKSGSGDPGVQKCSQPSHAKTHCIRYIYQRPQQVLSVDCEAFGLTIIRWG
jgi:hypothetical protein